MSRYHKQLNSARWKRTREAVLLRDLHVCQSCKRMAFQPEVDHIRPLHRYPDQDPYAPANCQVLCKPCHAAKTRREMGHKPPVPGRAAWEDFLSSLTNH